MRAIRKKLKSRGGATILMALLFFLVAVMVSTVIISAANTATKTVAARKSNQQAYLDVSSAAEYLRDAIQQEDQYQAVVLKEGVNATSNPDGTKQTLTTPTRSGIIRLVDDLFTTAFGSNLLEPFPVDPTQDTVYTKAYTVIPTEGAAEVRADMRLQMSESDEPSYLRKFTLTVNFTTQDQTGAPCKMTLRMQGGIRHTKGETETKKTVKEIYDAIWFDSKTELWRPGLREETA